MQGGFFLLIEIEVLYLHVSLGSPSEKGVL